jgi:hypothetical protein
MSAPTHVRPRRTISDDLTVLRALKEAATAADIERRLGQAGARVAPARLREVLTDQVHAYRVMAVGLGDARVYRRMPLGDKTLADAALTQERAL